MITAIYGSPHGWEMVVRLGEGLELTDALWGLVPVVVAAGEGYDQISPEDAADRSAASRRLNADDRASVRAAARKFAAALDSVFHSSLPDDAQIAAIGEAELIANPFGVLGSLIDMPRFGNVLLSDAIGLLSLSSDQALYFRAYMTAKTRQPRTEFLLKALFVTVIGIVEPLVTRLVRLLIHRQEPQAYSSLADPVLERESRRRCFGPPGTWRSVLVDQLGVAELAGLVDWDRLGRLWEDRNVLVHRAGVVDARHSQKTGSAANTVLTFDASDVQSLIDEIAAIRFALVIATWHHLDPGMGVLAAEAAGGPIFDSLRSGRWRQAEGLAHAAEVFAGDAGALATAKVNRWLARQAGLGPEAIQAEVAQWDVSGLPETYAVARLILLRRDPEAVAGIAELLRNGQIDRADIRDWPLFDRLNDEGELAGILAEPETRRPE